MGWKIQKIWSTHCFPIYGPVLGMDQIWTQPDEILVLTLKILKIFLYWNKLLDIDISLQNF